MLDKFPRPHTDLLRLLTGNVAAYAIISYVPEILSINQESVKFHVQQSGFGKLATIGRQNSTVT